MTHDGLGKYLSEVVEKAWATPTTSRILRETGTDVVVNYLPVGSEEATKWHTEQILQAGCAMVNRDGHREGRLLPEALRGRRPADHRRRHRRRSARRRDRVLTSLFRERGALTDDAVERRRELRLPEHAGARSPESKKISKTNAVTSMLDYDMGAENVHVGPSDYVPWLTDRKWAYIRMEGTSFGDVPLNVELKLEVWDSPNSAGIVIDAVRMTKLALNNGISGALEGPSAYLMKSLPKQIVDDEAYEAVESFIKYARKTAKAKATAQEVSRTAWPWPAGHAPRRLGRQPFRQNGAEDVDDSRVELAVRAAAELVDRLSRRDGAPVRAVDVIAT